MVRVTAGTPIAGQHLQMVPVHPLLRKYFARPHVGFVEDSTGEDSWVEYPNGMVTMIINVGDAFGGHPSAFVAGLSETFDVIGRDGAIECLDMKLTPPGARRLLGIPLGELTGSIVALRDLLDPFTTGAAESLDTESAWTARCQLLDAALLRRHDDQTNVDPRIEWAWRRITARQGMLSIRDLAEEVGWSQRHFIRSFRRELGLTPHKLSRITRFNAVLPELRTGRIDGASLAAGHGYADQSHLIREVREFTGSAPNSLAGTGRP